MTGHYRECFRSYSRILVSSPSLLSLLLLFLLVHNSSRSIVVVDGRPYRPPPGYLEHHSSSTSTNATESTVVECTLANFQQCISELWSGGGTGGGDLAFPTTNEQLQLTCNDLKDRVRCLDRHSERCFTHEMMQVFGHIVTNAKQFVHDLCDDHKVQEEYLIHAKCFRNISLDEQKCAQEYQNAIALPPLTDNDQNPAQQPQLMEQSSIFLGQQHHRSDDPNIVLQIKEIIMRRSCCALQELVLCKRRHVREQCGESASIFMRDHLPRITNPVLEQHCQAYTYGPGTCDEALYGVSGRVLHSNHAQLPNGAIILQRQQQVSTMINHGQQQQEHHQNHHHHNQHPSQDSSSALSATVIVNNRCIDSFVFNILMIYICICIGYFY